MFIWKQSVRQKIIGFDAASEAVIPICMVLFAVLLLLFSCEKWDYERRDFPEVHTTEFDNINLNSARANATITQLGRSKVLQVGHCWSAQDLQPSLSDQFSVIAGFNPAQSLNFQSEMTDLFPETGYFVRAYIIYEGFFGLDTTYEAQPRIVTTNRFSLNILNIAYDGFVIKVVSGITGLNGDSITAFGHCWSDVSTLPSLDDGISLDTDLGPLQQDSVFQEYLSNLVAGKTYYVRAYIIYREQKYYSNTNSIFLGDFWERKARFPIDNSRYGGAGCTLGGKIYYGLGLSDGNFQKDWWCYDPLSDTWTQQADIGGSERVGAISFALNNRVYAGLGFANVGLSRQLWAFNPDNNTWVQKRPYPPAMPPAYGVAFTINSLAYVTTGQILQTGFYPLTLYAFDPYDATYGLDNNGEPIGRWVKKATFPGQGRSDAAAFTIGNSGYLGTGKNDTDHLFDFWKYDPNDPSNGTDERGDPKGKWFAKANLGNIGRIGAAGFSIGPYGYMGLGISDSIGGQFFRYYPLLDNWTILNSPDELILSDFSVSVAGQGYLINGFDGRIWKYVPLE